MVRSTTPRPCIKCGNDSVRHRIEPVFPGEGATLMRVIIQCCNQECLEVFDTFEFKEDEASVPINVMVDRAFKAYEREIAEGHSFKLETEAGLLM